MQYSHYHSSSHQSHHVPQPSQSPGEYPPAYPDPSQQHAAVTLPTFPAGSIVHQNIPPNYNYPAYPTDDDPRSYYATSSQASAGNHYPVPGSPTSSYTTAPLTPQPSRHHAQVTQQQQQQQPFIPTPSQAYQVFSSAGSPSARSRVEPYYHMSPNPQHAGHALPPSTTHGTGSSRSSTTHSPGSSHSPHPLPAHHTHTGTIVVPAGERYPCDRCDRSFTRLHDRRRHYETVHSTSPVLHKCRYCRKDFSRSDSLKRHVDNGCDEMPR